MVCLGNAERVLTPGKSWICVHMIRNVDSDKSKCDKVIVITYESYFIGLGRCDDTIENLTIFEITSPGYPNGYPTEKDCKQRIRFEESFAVKLTFLEFFLESEDNCQ